MSDRARDRRVVRRALGAGAVTWVAVGAAFALALADAGGRAGVVSLLLGLMTGGVVASAWLLTALVLDALAGHHASPARLAWTFGVTAVTLVAPVLLFSAGG